MSGRGRLIATVRSGEGAPPLDVAFDSGDGVVAIVGPNGAGKSTLLRALVGLVPLAAGRVVVEGGDGASEVLFDHAAGVDVPVERRRLGWVPQHQALLPQRSARGNLELALRFSGCPSAEITGRADAALRRFGLETCAERRPAALSGGERQRLALTRALVTAPRALLLDEPLAALDLEARPALRAALAADLAALGIPAVVVTHDPADAVALAASVVVLERGRVAQRGSMAELAAAPATAFVAAWVAGTPSQPASRGWP